MAAPAFASENGDAAQWRKILIAPAGSVKSEKDVPTAYNCTLTGCTLKERQSSDLSGFRPVSTRPAGSPLPLPDGRVAVPAYVLESGQDSVQGAYYSMPTGRYGHGVLGDAIEAGSLTLLVGKQADTAQAVSFELPQNEVFEDIYPRLVDFDGLGKFDVVTLLSDNRSGAAVAVYRFLEGKIVELARTPHIGLSNRWRNIAGIADYDGDGSLQIAEVTTPHIGGTLNFWTLRGDVLELTAQRYGFSNHAIGSRVLELSATTDFNGDGVSDLALPDDSRRTLVMLGFEGEARGEKTLIEYARFSFPSQIAWPISVDESDEVPTLTIALKDGSVWAVFRDK